MKNHSLNLIKLLCDSFNVYCDFVGEELVPMIEAKQCNKTWNCKGDDQCRADCQKQFKGTGMCDLVTAPSVPKQCFCVYPC